MKLNFQKARSNKDIKNVYEYNIDAFSESPDFNWNLKEIEKEVSEGWDLYAAYLGEEVIAAIFLKEEKGQLLSKTTSIKMNYQGSGYSHKIKEFIEESAEKNKIKQVVNFCGIDNFRMYSLNESHGYKKTGRKLGIKGTVVEWVKILGKK
jgi:isocitrate lyase